MANAKSVLDGLWGFHLTKLPERRTRLVVSGYASARPRRLPAIADLLVWAPARWIQKYTFTAP